jgi:hypothetical protein
MSFGGKGLINSLMPLAAFSEVVNVLDTDYMMRFVAAPI